MLRQGWDVHGGYVRDRTWGERLAGIRSYPSKKEVALFMEGTAQPALAELVGEFIAQGHPATLDIVANEHPGISSYALLVTIPDHRDFLYQVQAVEAPVPIFGGRMSRETDVYYRVEVFAQTGSEGYDLMGVTHQQMIDDVLDRYEAHLGFLTYSNQHDYASVLTPPAAPATGSIKRVEPADVDAAEVEPAGDGDSADGRARK